DDVHADPRTLRVLVAPSGHQVCHALRITAVNSAFPRGEAGDGRQGLTGGLLLGVVAEHGAAHGVLVETEGVRAEDGLGDAAAAALVDVSALVDEERVP